MLSCFGRYIMLSTLVTKEDSSPVHSQAEHVYVVLIILIPLINCYNAVC